MKEQWNRKAEPEFENALQKTKSTNHLFSKSKEMLVVVLKIYFWYKTDELII